jgi:hypothetical protein
VHTLWSADTLLGEAELAPVADAPDVLSGPFRPAPAFAAVWPTLSAAQARAAPLLEPGGFLARLAALAPGTIPTPSDAAALAGAPGVAELVAAGRAVEALGLELRDAAGRPVGGVAVQVAHAAAPPPIPGMTPEERAGLAADPALADRYTLVAIPRRRSAGARVA